MIDKFLTLQLGGKERTLLYGTMGYFTYIKEATKKEPFEFLKDFDKKREESANGTITVLVEDIAVLVYAGLNSYLDSRDEPNIPIDKVKKWCNALTIKSCTDICTYAFGSIGEEESEPGEPPTQAVNNGKV